MLYLNGGELTNTNCIQDWLYEKKITREIWKIMPLRVYHKSIFEDELTLGYSVVLKGFFVVLIYYQHEDMNFMLISHQPIFLGVSCLLW